MARREDMKRIESGFDVLRHRILADVTDALRMELNERAHVEMPEPAGKADTGDKISVKVVFQGEISERDQLAAREVLQAAKNPAQLMFLLRKHKGGV